MTYDRSLELHKQWLGMVQPNGLVVTPTTLVEHGIEFDPFVYRDQSIESVLLKNETEEFYHLDFDKVTKLFTDFFGYPKAWFVDVQGDADHMVNLPELDASLVADYVISQAESEDDPVVYVKLEKSETDLDAKDLSADWNASLQQRFERFLRDRNCEVGLYITPRQLRLIFCPAGESTGFIDFPIHLMTTVAGRSVLSAFHGLLKAMRIYGVQSKDRLHEILRSTRKYQNKVSEALAEQVLASLYDLIRGIQAADNFTNGKLLAAIRSTNINVIYEASINVLMRLIFILYAEDRGLFPDHPVYASGYSVKGLYQRLQADEAKYSDSMDQRYGAWSQLLSLFRMIYNGLSGNNVTMPPRHGQLFDPNRFPFLEGRQSQADSFQSPLKISDGTIFRILRSLIVINGEYISYRALDVEHIGSVYETLMGFNVEVTTGQSIAINVGGAPVHINLEEFLSKSTAARTEFFKKQTGHAIPSALKLSTSVEAAVDALGRRIARYATPSVIPSGSLILQPTDERRNTGSHYTPRALTRPVVEKALEPVLKKLGASPAPEQIIKLKICDPAMGSGAFLVEVVRQLADILVKSWTSHGIKVQLPPNEDEQLYARRLIAASCIYGVDKNPMATDLAKLSIWLATFAKDQPFTFLDHALKCGDSLLGLSLQQIESLTWESETTSSPLSNESSKNMVKILKDVRGRVISAISTAEYDALEEMHKSVEESAAALKHIGNMILAAYFGSRSDRTRRAALANAEVTAANILADPSLVRAALTPLPDGLRPFHWELEFPEVFDECGFDSFIGNPPYAGKNTLAKGSHEFYPAWLQIVHEPAHGNSDVVAHFFRRAFNYLGPSGTLGFVTTNTVAQGDTRWSGLRWICNNGGEIYSAFKRKKWPGRAAVVVSIVHISKGFADVPKSLNGRQVKVITTYLSQIGPNENPARLFVNSTKSYQGSIILGLGFTFDDSKPAATPIAEMHRLIAKNPKNKERIFPFIGGDEVNDSPTHAHHRYVINFENLSEMEAKAWPDLYRIVEEKVKPERLKKGDLQARSKWWLFLRRRPELYEAIKGLDRVLCISQTTKYFVFAFLDANKVFSSKLVVFPTSSFSFFGLISSTIHTEWAYFFSATMKDDPVYTPSDCFDTFPFPENASLSKLESVGEEYYSFRKELMKTTNLGLTDTYNKFHDPLEQSPEIWQLRKLHAKLDVEVLKAYGWHDIIPEYEFNESVEDDDTTSTDGRRLEKTVRYGWPQHIIADVILRLANLNSVRAAMQSDAQSHATSTTESGEEDE